MGTRVLINHSRDGLCAFTTSRPRLQGPGLGNGGTGERGLEAQGGGNSFWFFSVLCGSQREAMVGSPRFGQIGGGRKQM